MLAFDFLSTWRWNRFHDYEQFYSSKLNKQNRKFLTNSYKVGFKTFGPKFSLINFHPHFSSSSKWSSYWNNFRINRGIVPPLRKSIHTPTFCKAYRYPHPPTSHTDLFLKFEISTLKCLGQWWCHKISAHVTFLHTVIVPNITVFGVFFLCLI